MSVISAHINVNLRLTPISLLITLDNEVIATANVKSPYRLELKGFPLSKGEYKIVITELVHRLSQHCIRFSGYAVVENINKYIGLLSMQRQKLGCLDIDQPNDLNLVGQMENGELHWNKVLTLDYSVGISSFWVSLEQASQLRIHIKLPQNIQLDISIVEQDSQKLVEKFQLSPKVNNMKAVLDPGKYTLRLEYKQNIQVHRLTRCASLQTDLHIIPMQKLRSLEQRYHCTDNQEQLPLAILDLGTLEEHYFYTKPINSKILLNVTHSSHAFIELSFVNSLSGYIEMELFTTNLRKIAQSVGIENMSQISADIPEGIYMLQITGSPQTAECFPIKFRYAFSQISNVKQCLTDGIPYALWAEEAGKFGGPPLQDGAVNFSGRFSILQEDDYISTVLIQAPEDLVIKVTTISDIVDVNILLTIYKNEDFEERVANGIVRGKESVLSALLPAQEEAYVLAISLVNDDTTYECHNFLLMISADSKVILSNYLQCNSDLYESTLPPAALIFENEEILYQYDQFAIKSDWIFEKSDDVPVNVISNPEKDQPFVYRMVLQFKQAGYLSIEANYDYISTDIGLYLYKDLSLVERGQPDPEPAYQHNFSNVISPIEMPVGSYILLVQQERPAYDIAKHLQDSNICYEFSLGIQFEPYTYTQKLKSVKPSGHQDMIMDSDSFEIKLAFSERVQLDVSTLYGAITLDEDSFKQIHPFSIQIDENNVSQIVLTFHGLFLEKGKCYTLNLPGEITDNLKHEYCMSECQCNPKSKAHCSEFSECICPFPFTGSQCEECELGYNIINGKCIKSKAPEISKLIQRQSSYALGEMIILQIWFNTRPYDFDLKPLRKAYPGQLINSFVLQSEAGNRYRANEIFPIDSDFLKWQFEWSTEAWETGIYVLICNSSKIVDKGAISFKMENPRIEYKLYEASSLQTCSGNGTLIATICRCNEGFTGQFCEECDAEYISVNGICVKQLGEGASIHCSGHGKLILGKCACFEGFTGGQCEFEFDLQLVEEQETSILTNMILITAFTVSCIVFYFVLKDYMKQQLREKRNQHELYNLSHIEDTDVIQVQYFFIQQDK